jgi:hypothetical protein
MERLAHFRRPAAAAGLRAHGTSYIAVIDGDADTVLDVTATRPRAGHSAVGTNPNSDLALGPIGTSSWCARWGITACSTAAWRPSIPTRYQTFGFETTEAQLRRATRRRGGEPDWQGRTSRLADVADGPSKLVRYDRDTEPQ